MNLTNLFIQNICINFPNCFFRYREDAKGAIPAPFPTNVINTKDNTVNWEMIKEKDDKYAISFTPNGDYYYSQKSRTQDKAGRVYAIAIDCDTWWQEWENFPLEPSFVVKTKRGEHIYWLLKNPTEYHSIQKDYQRIMNTLVNTYWADWQAKDINRMFRLPGTTHKKDMDNIHVTECVKYSPDIKYTLEDFLNYCEVEKGDVSLSTKTKYHIRKDDWEVFDAINDVHVLDVLSCFDDIAERRGQLALWGRWTGGYKYWKEKNYLKSFSNEGLRATWWPFSVAKFYLKNNVDVFKFFEERFWIRQNIKLAIPIKRKEDKQLKENINNDITSNAMRKQREIDFSQLQTTEDNIAQLWAEQVTVSIEHTVGKDTYKFSYDHEIIMADSQVIVDGFFTCVGAYENNGIMYYVIYAKKNGVVMTKVFDRLHSGARLEYWLSYMGLTFSGTKNHAKGIISIIHQTNNKMVFINKAGLYPNWLVINKKWEYIVTYEDMYYYCNIDNKVTGKDWIDSNLIFQTWEDNSKKYLMDVVTRVCECHNPDITYPLFVIYAMGMMSYILKELGIKIPGALVYGNPGSGKSETILNIQKILWIPSHNIQWDSSKFSFDFIAKHYLPVKIAEYDRVKQKFDVDTFLKNSYDWEGSARGTKEQALIEYENNSLFIVDGENRSMNTAVYSRNFAFHFTAKDLKERTEKFQKMIKDWYLEKNVLWYFFDRKDKLMQKWFHDIIGKYRSDITPKIESYDIQEKWRMIDNYSVTLAFLERMDLLELKEYVHTAFINQLDMFGDSKIDKTIKQFCMKALFDRTTIMLNGEHLEIPAYIDSFRSDINRADDAQGNIMVANSILAPEFAKNNTDTLYVPHSYMQSKKNLHSIYNNVLNNMHTLVDFGKEARSIVYSIKVYAEVNWYTMQPFYDDTVLSIW